MIKKRKRLYTGVYMIKKLSCHLCKISACFAFFGLFSAFLSCCLIGVYMARQMQVVIIQRVILCCLVVFNILLYLM